jgi:DNA-binding response OmpR family regulator
MKTQSDRSPLAEVPFMLAIVQLGDYRIDLLQRHIRNRDNQSLQLTPGEFSLLTCLLTQRGRVVGRCTLLAALHPGQEDRLGDLRTVDTLMVRLRRKLERDPAHPVLIQTVYGKGYRLALEEELTATPQSQATPLAG